MVVPCVVSAGLEGVPMLIVQPLDKTLKPKGKALVAADATRMAAPGELVSYEGGREAALALDRTFVPVDHSIVAIVDGVSLIAPEAGT
jgi:ethanolamine utilization protein EutN